jgi:DeoR/GlpR family transcriptional regulator of sugar metabolism
MAAPRAEERREQLHRILQRDGYQSVAALAEQLGRSVSTVRRDLSELAASGLLYRTHGGALALAGYSTSHEPTLLQKQRLLVEEKRRIGQAAASQVRPGDTVILDSGSTTWQVGQALKSRTPLTVVTNDIKILWDLANTPDLTLISTGGLLRPNVYTLLGSETVRFLNTLQVNWTFLGADAVDLQGGVTNVNLEEVAVKQAMLQAGRYKVLVTNHTKFGKTVFARVCELAQLDQIVSDTGLPHPLTTDLAAIGIKVQRV